MMATLFDRLEYNFQADEKAIVQFSNTAVQMLETLPPFLDEWQYDALKNKDESGYLQNPVAFYAISIINIANDIMNTSNDVIGLEGVVTSASSLADQAQQFYDHTERLSGLAEIQPETAELPHYDLAIAIGKAVTYLIFQSDGKTDNETIMGNFTSILIADVLNTRLSEISVYATTISNSITCEMVPVIPGDPESPLEQVCTTSLSGSETSEISAALTSLSGYLQTRRNHDENFYTKSRELLESFNKQQRFKDYGATERNLFNNYIGSQKLLNNLNQN